MVKKLRRRWQLGEVRPGDGSALAEYRGWQVFSRSLYRDGVHWLIDSAAS